MINDKISEKRYVVENVMYHSVIDMKMIWKL